MASPTKTQPGFWVGPRLFLSTLHFHNWIGEFASINECEQFRQTDVSFTVESEISQTILSEYSPRVQLIAFNVDNDVGLFKLQDKYADQKNFVNIDWIMERDDVYSHQLPTGAKAACCGFSGAISEFQSKQVQDQAAHHLSQMPVAFVSCY